MRAPIPAVVASVIFCTAGCKARGPSEDPRASAPPPAAADPAPAGGAPEGEIVTDTVRNMNGEEYGRPPVKFRPGHPTRRSAPRAARTANGFSVQFASRATMTTPTVYERKVIVSGGFKSKELYAFDATTGESVWAIDLHDDGPSSPACENDVNVGTDDGKLVAIDTRDAKLTGWSTWGGNAQRTGISR
jgi:PQQ-like domain